MKSIIIPVFNQHDFTNECILAVRECTDDYEIVLVDNGSNPPYVPPFTGFNETILIRNEENRGFPAAVNQGIRAANGDVIVLLNNDVIVTPGWADDLPDMLEEFGIVAPVTGYAAGYQKVGIGFYGTKDGLYEQAQEWTQEYRGCLQEVNFVIGFCMAFKKALFDEIGEFDESLWPCSGEEIDFCFRARQAGHKVIINHGVYVHHEGSQTFKEMERDGMVVYSDICKRNDEHLAKRWGYDFWLKQAVQEEEVINA